jgi:cyanophycinase
MTDQSNQLRSIFLFADSQLLFWRQEDGALVLEKSVETLPMDQRRAAYLGGSNGDDPKFFGIFEGAMDLLGISERRMILADPTVDMLDCLRTSRLILLTGGDVGRGWRAFSRTGVAEIVVHAYRQGAVLVGISAGAIQLGLGGPFDGPFPPSSSGAAGGAPLRTFGLVELWLDVHDEADRWQRLRGFLSTCPVGARGLGIPFGSGTEVQPDGSLRAIRSPVQELVRAENNVLQESLPPEA